MSWRAPVGEVEDDQPRAVLLARQQNEPPASSDGVDEIAAVAMGDDLAPVRLEGASRGASTI